MNLCVLHRLLTSWVAKTSQDKGLTFTHDICHFVSKCKIFDKQISPHKTYNFPQISCMLTYRYIWRQPFLAHFGSCVNSWKVSLQFGAHQFGLQDLGPRLRPPVPWGLQSTMPRIWGQWKTLEDEREKSWGEEGSEGGVSSGVHSEVDATEDWQMEQDCGARWTEALSPGHWL